MWTLYLQIKIAVALSGLDNRKNFRLITIKNKIVIRFQNYFNETTTIFNIFHHLTGEKNAQ